jgi:hypothetical protein
VSKSKRILSVSAVCLIVIFVAKFDLSLSQGEIIGTYVNRNFDRGCGTEISDKPDTLQLFAGNKFKSNYYGEGKYKVNEGWPQNIELSYNYEFGKAGFSANSSSTFFESTKIMTNYDLNCYYEKLKSQ